MASLPEGDIKNALALVTGTLGLAYPQTEQAMMRAVDIAKGSNTTVLPGLESPLPACSSVV